MWYGQILKSFWSNEDGAVSVDMVVGAAAGITLAMIIMQSIGDAAQDHADRISSKVTEIGIKTYGGLESGS